MPFTDGAEHVVVTGAAIYNANGVYNLVKDQQDGKGKTYVLEVPDSHRTYILQLRNENWRISSSNSGEIYSAPISLDDPEFPPLKGWKVSGFGSGSLPTVTVFKKLPVLSSTRVSRTSAAIFSSLLFAEEFSDVQLVSSDNVIIPAHKSVLAASSEYFQAAFRGPWKENKDGLLETSYPAHVIKEMLELIYTGKTKSDLVREEPLVFLSVAAEFDLPWLKSLAEPSCIHSLDSNNLKNIWMAGYVYNIEAIKKACIDFTKKNALEVLTTSSIFGLKGEDPSSWEEFVTAVKG